jgi:DNA/RNA endonuclease YhcR with UshA esterase domain
MKRHLVVMVVLACFAGTGATWAHHSFEAEYDRNLPVAVTGTVTLMEWANPHIYFFIDIENEEGEVTNWAVEGGAPNGLYRRGWRKDSLKTGDIVEVEGWLARDGSNSMNSGSVIRQSDGLRLFAGTSNPDAPNQ